MNEGWATFWHYTIMNELFDEDLVSHHFMMEFLHNHTNVIYQVPYDNPHFNGLNPYMLGFTMFSDLKRIAQNPTEEDKRWFPDIAGTDWINALDFSMKNFKDESFVAQFLSPTVIRDLKLFSILDDEQREDLQVEAIHNEEGYHQIRQLLSENFNLSNQEPDIQVHSVDVRGDRSLVLRYTQRNKRPLDESYHEVLKHVYTLWGFPVKLEMLTEDGKVELLGECPPKDV